MTSIIKSISLNNVENEFLMDYQLSPTQLLKEKIWEMKGAVKKMVQDKIDKLTWVIQDQANKINELEEAAIKKSNVLEKQKGSDKKQ